MASIGADTPASPARATTDGLITVVIPVWGAHAAYAPEAVATVRQDDVPVRVLLVANAADEPGAAPPGAEVLRLPERVAVGAARNAGLWQVDTPYVMFWDADDLMLPGTLSRLAAVLDADPGTVAVTAQSRSWTPEGGPREIWPWPRDPMYRLCNRPRLFALVSTILNPFTTTGPALLRTAPTKDAGGFAEEIEFFEDWSLSTHLAIRGRVRMLRAEGRLYRVHGDSLSLGHLDHPDQHLWLAGMRRRIRRDPATPRWMRLALPLVRLGHALRIRRAKRPDVGLGLYEDELGVSAGNAAETPATGAGAA
jgi:glycosyltransferase involved in cell wall biosynthesis